MPLTAWRERVRAGATSSAPFSPELGGRRARVPLDAVDRFHRGNGIGRIAVDAFAPDYKMAGLSGRDLDRRRQRAANHVLDAGDLEPEGSVKG